MDEIIDFPSNERQPTHYAGFWIRFVAFILDYILMMVVGMVVSLVTGIGAALTSSVLGGFFGSVMFFGPYILYFLYQTLMVASKSQGTLGKMAVGIKVGDEHGSRLSFGVAALRFFAAGLSWITMCLGFILAAFDIRKQALHDKIARTYVFYTR